MATINERYLDSIISHKVQIERFANGAADRVLENIKTEIKKRIYIPDNINDLPQSEVRRKARQIENELREIIRESYSYFEKEMLEMSSYELNYNRKTMKRLMPVSIEINESYELPDDDFIAMMQLGDNETSVDAFERIASKTSKNYKNIILKGYKEGVNPRIVADNLFKKEANTIFGATNLKKLENNIKTISRTAMNSINAEVNQQILKENENLLKGYLWTSTLDSRTSIICASRDGTFYKVGEEKRPPAHYNCRSILTPVFKSDKDLGIETRASMDGQVPSKTTYEDFLRKKPESFIKDVLGDKRGQLFIDGKIKDLGKFVDASGRTYTLKELAKRENIDL